MALIKKAYDELKSALNFFGGLSISFGISPLERKKRIPNALYLLAVEARRLNFFYKGGGYVFYDQKSACRNELTDISQIDKKLSVLVKGDFKELAKLTPISVDVSGVERNISNIEHLKSFFERWYYIAFNIGYEQKLGPTYANLLKRYDFILKDEGSLDELIAILNTVLKNIGNVETSEHIVVKKIKDIIYENYKTRVSLSRIADALEMNKKYIGRIFKQSVGKSFNKYLAEYRIKKAIELMKTTNMNITEISVAVGFDEVSNFYRAFKEVIGETPKNYIQKSGL